MQKSKVIDVSENVPEFEKIEHEISLLNLRFLALAMDYKFYIGNDIRNTRVYQLRDRLLYRLNSAKFHGEILFRQIQNIKDTIERNALSDDTESIPVSTQLILYTQQVAALFESFLIQVLCVFDELSKLIYYVSGHKKENQVNWSSLLTSVRDRNKVFFSRAESAVLVEKIELEFISKLRTQCDLVPRGKSEIGGFVVSRTYRHPEKIKIAFLSGRNMNKRLLDKNNFGPENKITLRFIVVNVLNETIRHITDLLFSMKEEMELNIAETEPVRNNANAEDDEKNRISINYWNEKRYREKD